MDKEKIIKAAHVMAERKGISIAEQLDEMGFNLALFPKKMGAISLLEIKQIVAYCFGITANDIPRKTRRHEVLIPRQAACYCAIQLKEEMNWNERTIGNAMGVDRATVYWSVKKTLENAETNYMKLREKLPIIQDKITKKRYENGIREEREAAAVGTSAGK